jgi:peptidoglycan/LPS O-acetylase OafA/YrhL
LLAAVIGTAWAWALVAFGLGWWSTTRWSAAVTGVLALAIAAVVYYVSDHAFGLNDELETGEMAYWMAMSLGVGSVFGLLGHLARRPRWWSLLPALTAPVLVVMFSYPTGSDHIRPWPERVAWIVAVALTIAITLRWLRLQRRPTRASP